MNDMSAWLLHYEALVPALIGSIIVDNVSIFAPDVIENLQPLILMSTVPYVVLSAY